MTLAGLSILVLEDEAIIAMVLEDGLIDLGANPLMADTIEQAEHILREGARIDAAILDVNVHGRQSYDFARVLAASGVRYVFASGYGNTAPPDLAHVATVTKPYNLQAIALALTALSGNPPPASAPG